MRAKIGVLLMVGLWITLMSQMGWSHDLPIERSLMITVHQDRLEMLALYAEPPGIRSERVMALYDLDRNGRLTGKELAIAMPDISERAFKGLAIKLGNLDPRIEDPEMVCKPAQNKGLSCAIYVEVPLPAGPPETVEVGLLNKSGIVPLFLRASASAGVLLARTTVDGKAIDAGAVVTLRRGQRWRAEVTRDSVLAKPEPLK